MVLHETAQVIDALHPVIGASSSARIVIINVEASLPRRPEEDEEEEEPRREANKTAASREELYNSIEKNARLEHLRDFQARHADSSTDALRRLQDTARSGGNLFTELLDTVRTCSLGQISNALYEVGGRYRRNM